MIFQSGSGQNAIKSGYAVVMIRRDATSSMILISQHDHSLLCGEMARRLGNGLFASPLPFASTVRAIAEHDCGWAGHDQWPTLNGRGLPAHVFEAETATALDAWGKSVDQAVAADAYAGMLVSLHTMALANRASMREPEGADELSRQQAFRLRRFVHRQIELQETLRGRLGMRIDLPLRGGLAESGRSPEEDLLRANFLLLEFLDQLSLNLCFDQVIFGRIEAVHPRPGEPPIGVRFGREGNGAMRVDPWPFNCEQLELEAPGRVMKGGPYANVEGLKSAFDSAEAIVVKMRLCAWGGGGYHASP
jgi:Protein of unknown function (DUF3891)